MAVKGNAETSYRTGNVNLTPANIGALPLSGGTITSNLTVNGTIKFGKFTCDSTNNNVILSSTGMHLKSSNSAVYCKGTGTYSMNPDGTTYQPVFASAFTQNSSKRYKENFSDITTEEAKKLLDIKTYHFDYIDGKKNQSGCIAEEVEGIFPEICVYGRESEDDEEDVLIGLSYDKFVPYLIKIVQIQQNEIDKLRRLIG